jgi:hypothetical protein
VYDQGAEPGPIDRIVAFSEAEPRVNKLTVVDVDTMPTNPKRSHYRHLFSKMAIPVTIISVDYDSSHPPCTNYMLQ